MPINIRLPNLLNDKYELLSVSRIVTEIEYLLLLLVLLYVVVPGTTISSKHLIIFGSVLCTGFIVILHYLFNNILNRRILALETFVMTIFITFVVWHSGMSNSPLVNLYLIIVVGSAMTLGRNITLLLVSFIIASLLAFDLMLYQNALFTMANFDKLMQTFVTMYTLLLVAYMTLMLAAHMEKAHNRVKMLSERDELTGLLNMRAFTNLLARTFKQASRYHRQFAILMVDADNLKVVNDEYGHAAGDQLILIIAEALQFTTRGSDTVARYGGDEFIVLLPETDAVGSEKYAERLRQQIAKVPLLVGEDKQVSTTVSIGIACYPEDALNPEELVNEADRALYQSKSAGRNRVTMAATLQEKSSSDKLEEESVTQADK